ncbi:MAG: DNA mismatch repair protein MutS [Clostridia bacterium]|nr:DNA mismatch repair protein MutS [Clostridia bacterium]
MANTPMMKQYLEIKAQYPDTILFFRLGDFYEMFLEDALTASKALEITWTSRDAGQKEKVPMCGVPYHSAESYIAKLIAKGYKVAICEQMKDPETTRGIVQREVVRIITPGTVLDSLEDKEHNFLSVVWPEFQGYGLAIADISTGLLQIGQFSFSEALADELFRLQPAELLLPDMSYSGMEQYQLSQDFLADIKNRIHPVITRIGNELFQENKALKKVKNLWSRQRNWKELQALPLGLLAAGVLLLYLEQTQKKEIKLFSEAQLLGGANFMILDANTRRNLELTASLRDNGRWGTLIWVLDHTQTSMGSRLLKNWLERPLLEVESINQRLEAVAWLVEDIFSREQLTELLNGVHDLERLTSRAVSGPATARDLLALKESLLKIPDIIEILSHCQAGLLQEFYQQIDDLQDLAQELHTALNEEAPVSLKEGGLIREGYREDVDRLKAAAREGQAWLLDFEAQEKQRTGIKTLKVGFNKVFGYYLEVSKAQSKAVPEDYVRKQTLVNAERYLNPALKEMEEQILGAEEKSLQLEYEIFCSLRNKVGSLSDRLLKTAGFLAALDVIVAFAQTALKENYRRPRINEKEKILIKGGRHPVVEKVLGPGNFVANDLELSDANRLLLLTGPNMAGKSTYMRQIALLTIMAQAGSFIPAEEAEIGVIDRIFTRIGAADDLAGGQSTFMVEMKECQVILANATAHSLVIMDEVGRGTSTYDGISLARALVDYLLNRLRVKTIFSTHSHELTDLGELEGIQLYTMLVEEQENKIYFLHKVVPGKANCSYGIQVAALAGLPESVILQAQAQMQILEQNQEQTILLEMPKQRTDQFNPEQTKVLTELKQIDLLELTPLEAFQKIVQWKEVLNQ